MQTAKLHDYSAMQHAETTMHFSLRSGHLSPVGK